MTEATHSRSSKVRMSDLAMTAGVSIATVSRVLNGKDGVSDQARHAVLAALDLLGYQRPAVLTPQLQGQVGVVVPELSNPVFAEFASLITDTLANHGYSSLLCTQSPGGATEEDCIQVLAQRGTRGIIFVSGVHADTSLSHTHYQTLIDSGVALALINGHAADVDAASFATDDAAGVKQAVSHLRQLGHTSIALLVGPARFVPTQRKVAAFRTVMAQADSAVKPQVIESLFTIEGGHSAAIRATQAGSTALICGSDLMALGAVRGVRSMGFSVPEDISIVGYDDSSLAVFFDPALTTVRQPVSSIVNAAVTAVVHEIEGKPAPRVELLFRPEVILRQSTGVAPHRGGTL